MKEPLARIHVSPTQQRAAELFAFFADAIQFLGRTAWPVVDLIVRFWIAMPAILSGLLMANDWNTALMLAINEYPIPWLDPRTEALLAIVVQLAGGISLLLGLGTRLGALAIAVLNIATQVYYVTLDLNLFRVALAMGYVFRGPGPLSLDSLLIKGLSRSPIPVATPLAGFLNETRTPLSATYRFGLRVWLALALLMSSSVVSSALGHVAAPLSLWLPSASAAALFAGAGPLLAFPLGLGLATRLIAILALCAIGYSEMMAADDFSMFWTLGMALLLVSGPGALSLDGMILSVLKRRFPQLDGKPAFSLEGLPRVVIIGAGFGGIACARALRHTPVQVTLIDRHNYHLFQPLLYQVATAALSPGDIAVPIRSMFRDQFNTRVLLGNVTDIDARRQQVILQDLTVPFGIVTFIGFTCQWPDVHKAWMSKFQRLRTRVAELNSLENRLFLANVTMPSVVVHFGKRDPSGVTLARDVGLTCFALRVERVELLLEPIVGRLAGVDRAAENHAGLRVIRLPHVRPPRSRRSGLRGSSNRRNGDPTNGPR